MEKIFEHFKFRIASFQNGELYLHTSGYAYFQFWPSGRIKVLKPDNRGRICIRGKRINFNRLLYKIVFPNEDIRQKIIVRIGKTSNILNLKAISKNEIRSHLQAQKNGQNQQ